MADNFKEVLQIVFEVAGQDGVDKVATALQAVGKSAEYAGTPLGKAADELEHLNTTAGKIEGYASLKASVSETGIKLAQAQAGLAALNSEFDRGDTSSRKISGAFAVAEASVQRLTTQHNTLSAQLVRNGADLEKNGVSVSNLAGAHAELSAKVDVAAKNLIALSSAGVGGAAGLEKIKSVAGAVGGALKSAGEHALAFGKRLLEISGIAGVIATALAALTGGKIFGEGIKQADEFEHSITKAGIAVNATAEQLDQLGAAANAAAEATHVSAADAAAALAILAKGAGSANAAIAELQPTLLLARAAQIDAAQAADILGTAIAEFGLKAEDSTHVVDILAKTAGTTKSDLGELSTAFGKVAPDARAAGVSIEQTAALFGALSDQGIRGKKATSELTTIFQEMANPTSKLREQLLALGLSGDSLSTVLTKLHGNTAEAQRVIETLGTKGGSAFRALVSAAPDIERLNGVLGASAGAAQATADKFDKELGGAFANFKNAFIDATKELATPLLKPLAEQLSLAATAVRDFIKTADFAKIRDAVLDFTSTAIKAIREFFGNLDFKETSQKISDFVKSAGDYFKGFSDGMSTLGTVATATVNTIAAAFHGLQTFFYGVAAATDLTIAALLKSYQGYREIAGATGQEIEAIQGQVDTYLNAADTFYKRAAGSAEALANNFKGLAAATDTSAKAAAAAEPKVTAHAAAMDRAGEAAKGAADGTKQLSDAVVDAGPKIVRLSQAQIDAAKNARDLKTAFGTLGISLQSDLKDKAEAAAKALDVVIAAQQRGAATIEDVRRAYAAYAKDQLAAVADSDKAAQDAIKYQVEEKGYALDLKSTLDQLGNSGANAGNQIASGAESAAAALRDEAAAAKEAQQKTDEFSARGHDSLAQLDGALASTRVGFLNISDAAAKAFDARFYNDFFTAFDDNGTGFLKVANGMAQAAADTNTQIANQRTQLAGEIEAINNLGTASNKSFGGFGNDAASASARMAQLSQLIQQGGYDAGLLGQQELQPLQAALDAARQRMDALRAATEQATQQLASLNQQLQDERDQQLGDQTAIENRRYQQQLQNINDLAAKADAAGKAQAQADLALAEQIHQKKLADIASQGAAQKNANQQTQQQTQQQSGGAQGGAGSSGGGSSSAGGAIPVDLNINLDINHTGANGPLNEAQVQAIIQKLGPQLLEQVVQQLRIWKGRA